MYNLPKGTKVRDAAGKTDRRNYSIDDEGVRALIEEGLRHRLYLDGRPGTNNRLKVEVSGVWVRNGSHLELSAFVETWNEED